MFPLDNSTSAFTASFSRHISTLGKFGGPERTEIVAPLELMFSWSFGLPQWHVVPPLLAQAQVY